MGVLGRMADRFVEEDARRAAAPDEMAGLRWLTAGRQGEQGAEVRDVILEVLEVGHDRHPVEGDVEGDGQGSALALLTILPHRLGHDADPGIAEGAHTIAQCRHPLGHAPDERGIGRIARDDEVTVAHGHAVRETRFDANAVRPDLVPRSDGVFAQLTWYSTRLVAGSKVTV